MTNSKFAENIKNKIKNILKNNNGFSILNLEGSYLRKDNDGNLYYNTTEIITFKNKDGKEVKIVPSYEKLYSAKMTLSLETYRTFGNFNQLKDEIIEKDSNKPIDFLTYKKEGQELYSKLFINLKFEKKAVRFDKEGHKEITSKKDIRNNVYTDGVIVDGIKYVFFKRGGSKARTAQAIFVKEKYKELLLKPCLLGLKFKRNEKYDITSKEAYTSLIMSGIEDIIKIDRDSILIINDIDCKPFKANQSLTVMKDNGSVIQEYGEYEVVNCTTDGEGLMDESIYKENKFLNEATCALLRNDFLKCNACRTKLQEYYKENNITKVWDMYRGWMDASKIKLVITPNSCKYIKFADQYNNEKECFLDWLEKIPDEFGVVKTDHVGNYDYSNRLSYQMINSMNLTKDEVRYLMRYELEYINLLLNNSKYSKTDISLMNKEDKIKYKNNANEMTYFLNSIVSNNPYSTTDMVNNLVHWNKEYRFTREFKEFKKHTIAQYIKNLRTGAIRIQNSLYAIMISCPYEMLKATHSKNNKVDEWIMEGNECYNPNYEDGIDLLSIRNPQINAGNIHWMKNKYREEYKWFGYQVNGKHVHDFVVFVNSNGSDIMNRLQGADYDIDTTFLCDDKLLVQKAKENSKYYTPTNGIKGSKELRIFNEASLAELDNYLGKSTQYIGMIVNKSAIFNAYMYDGINKQKDEGYIKACYDASSTLSSYSQIAIDMAKKNFLGKDGKLLNLISMMSKLNDTAYNGEKILQYDYDTENIEKVEIFKVFNDYQKLIDIGEGNYRRKYKPVNKINMELFYEYLSDKEKYNNLSKEEKENSSLMERYNKKIEVYSLKMIAPMFFKYVAQDNTTRLLKRMDCGMDYLEEILDEIQEKPIRTNKIDIKDIINDKKIFKGRNNFKKIDEIRLIINECNTNLNKMYLNNNYNHAIATLLKKKAINKIKELNINEKTFQTIILRCFNLDKKYKNKQIKLVIGEKNIKIKEFKDMKSLTLALMFKLNKTLYLQCFKQDCLIDNLVKKTYFM